LWLTQSQTQCHNTHDIAYPSSNHELHPRCGGRVSETLCVALRILGTRRQSQMGSDAPSQSRTNTQHRALSGWCTSKATYATRHASWHSCRRTELGTVYTPKNTGEGWKGVRRKALSRKLECHIYQSNHLDVDHTDIPPCGYESANPDGTATASGKIDDSDFKYNIFTQKYSHTPPSEEFQFRA
jgi:hypothetical protein